MFSVAMAGLSRLLGAQKSPARSGSRRSGGWRQAATTATAPAAPRAAPEAAGHTRGATLGNIVPAADLISAAAERRERVQPAEAHPALRQMQAELQIAEEAQLQASR